ncbi:hypothetical protein NQ176_g1760 [Zarea fungicola]|uniref:Uncharacterized protein n=1 Tax=Zarea fungicola TaxID=93591 RepID=A0ACC1NTZ0_9HYPO|nr:hypothetical protein NQ176_g1760 [Lecanicillium fungicola]
MPAQLTSTAASSHALAFGILRLLDNDGDAPSSSKACSPLSIIIAIGMLAGAADSVSKKGLCHKLGIAEPANLGSNFEEILALLGIEDEHSAITGANGLFTDHSVTIRQGYLDFVAIFGASVTQYPQLDKAVVDINTWVAGHTRGLIQDLLSAGALRNAHAVLINTLAFKGTWKREFDMKNTQETKFHIPGQEPKLVSMMFQRGIKVASLEGDKYTAVRLPYTAASESQSTSLIAYLPSKDVSLRQFISDMGTAAAVAAAAVAAVSPSKFAENKFDVFGFPKFSLDTKCHILDKLSQLGFPLAGSYPELGGPNSEVSDVIHQAVIKIDEQGTEAAAATAVVMRRSRPVQSRTLIFDRPFYFALVHDESNLALFAGIFCGS